MLAISQFFFSSSGSFNYLPISLIDSRTIRLLSKLHPSTFNADFSCKKGLRAGKLRIGMPVTDSQTEHVSEIEAALLDAELFIKYHAPERAIKRLRTCLLYTSDAADE